MPTVPVQSLKPKRANPISTRFFPITIYLQQRIMPQRRPLGETSGNRPVGYELIVNDCAQIVGAVKCGVRIADAARAFDFTPSTVKTTVRRNSVRHANEDLPRSGRPIKATERDVCTIIRYVRVNPKHTYRQIKTQLRISLSASTIKRILAPFHIRKLQYK
jgi:transposase